MVKDETVLLCQKIRDTSDILRSEVPSEIATATLEERNPSDISYRDLKERTSRLVEKRVNGQWILENKSGSGLHRTILTPKDLGRIFKKTKEVIPENSVLYRRKSIFNDIEVLRASRET